MKTKTILLVHLLFFIAFAKASEKPQPKPLNSAIKEVTVYLSGAEITREATTQLSTGLNTIVIDKLSPDIDENSIQISGLGDATIQSINYGINYLTKLKYTKKVDSLKARLEVIDQTKHRIQNTIKGLQKEEDILNKNERLGSDTQEISLEKVKELAAFYRKRITALQNEVFEEELKIKTLKKEENDVRRQLQEYNVTEEIQTGEITLKINSTLPKTCLLYTSPSPRDLSTSRMPSSA